MTVLIIAVFSKPLPKLLTHSLVKIVEGFISSGSSPKLQEPIEGGFPSEEVENLSLISG